MNAQVHRQRLSPEWVRDLVSIWASDGRRSWSEGLGFPSVCPSFERGALHDQDLDLSYSDLEVAVMRSSITRLRDGYPRHYEALLRGFVPHTRHTIDAGVDVLLPAALHLLEQMFDEEIK
jgi:hypothetical protein